MPKRPTAIDQLPQQIPLFPLSGALLLPNTMRPLNIFEGRYVRMIDDMLAGDRLVGMIQPVQSDVESPKGNVPVRKVGCLGRLVQFEENSHARYFVVLEGIVRFRLLDEIDTGAPYRTGVISAEGFNSDFDPGHGENSVDRGSFLSMMRAYAEFAQLDIDWEEIETTGTADLVNMACMMSPYGPAEKQSLLEATSLQVRAETLMAMAELEMARSQPGRTLQ